MLINRSPTVAALSHDRGGGTLGIKMKGTRYSSFVKFVFIPLKNPGRGDLWIVKQGSRLRSSDRSDRFVTDETGRSYRSLGARLG